MNKVLISIRSESLYFSFITDYNKPNRNLNNTNIIDSNELVFSTEYIKKNRKIMVAFVNELMAEHNFKKIKISTYEVGTVLIQLFEHIKNLRELFFEEESSLPYALCETLVDIKRLESVSCSSVPPYMLEMFDRHNIKIETRYEVIFTSKFMELNNLTGYSKLYYKTNLRIENEFSEIEYEDFMTFLKVNRYLKTIHLYIFDAKMLDRLVKIMHSLRVKNVRILLHKNIDDKETALLLKDKNKEYKSNYNISLKNVYSENYLQNNLFRQMIVNFLKTCSVIIVIIVIAVFGTILFNNYLSLKKVESISKDLTEIIDKVEPDEVIDPNNTEEVDIISNMFKALLEVNDETVGWLKINNTKIDYPIVQAVNNEYYLTHDYYKSKEYNGWLYMDYRNSYSDLNRNTIIYGHNRFNSGVMFGTLNEVRNKKWYSIEENLVIEFNTLYKDYKWQIFSIYKIKETVDYIQTYFTSDDEYIKFLEMVNKRSINDFKVELNKDTKILTLSTCLEDNNRLVVHAALIQE